MRYTVRFYNGVDIINGFSTGNFSAAIAKEAELIEQYGKDNVWIADAIQEILVRIFRYDYERNIKNRNGPCRP